MLPESVHRIHRAAHAFDPDIPDQVRVLTDVLDEFASVLAASDDARQDIGNAVKPSIWPVLHSLWQSTARAHADPDPADAPGLIRLSVSLAKFTRNLVAANTANQNKAFVNDGAIRSLIYHYTSFNATQDPTSYPAARMLTQALSNIVTGNDALAQKLWSTYLNLPEEQLILTRLFASPDSRTVSSAFVLVLNCVHDSADRTELLVRSPRGPRICLTMLDRIASLFEAEEASEAGRAFDVGHVIIERIIEEGLAAELYIRLTVDEEVVTPHQTTLLKLVDSHLHASQHAHELALARRRGTDGARSLFDVLVTNFFTLCAYAQGAIKSAIASGGNVPAPDPTPNPPLGPAPHSEAVLSPPPLQNLDLLLPKVCEALVLVTQCLTTVALRAEEAVAARSGDASSVPTAVRLPPKELLVSATGTSGQGSVESLIETLRLIDVFIPRITYGRLARRPSPPEGAHGSMQEHEVPPQTADMAGAPPPQAVQAAQGFAHVKRDLVRLLGIMAAENRMVQDRVRACEGIPVVMNLCVVDDYNPYLREHAIFALRNILHDNRENQAVVDAIKPVGKWDEEKVLRDIRGGALSAPQ
ncbi:spinocerebellar ataxia type 10 protein domain-containing protein [Lenzites betulinus]|nr:spinocerebellar ataxia type 10 protein domain-containing protein [Lenzites betulinus]